MFSLFKKTDKKDQLNKKYKSLMKEYHRLSTRDRKAADQKMAKAEKVLQEMEKN